MNSAKKRLILFIISILAFSTIVFAGSSPSAEEQSGVAAYGALLSAAMDESENITQEEFFKTIDLFKTTVGRASAVIDVGTKIAGGDTKEAAISAAFATLSELAATQKGKAVLKFFQIGPTGFGLILTAYQIKRASDQALKSSTNARLLESLYGTIEANSFLHKRNRKFGQGGDPIPVTHEAVDYVWKKIVNGSWRSAFKPYVTEVMHASWPEARWWDRWFKPKEVQAQNLNEAILEKENEYKKYIATLLATLNNIAKGREATHEIRVMLRLFQNKFSQGSSNQLLYKYFKAKKALPKIKKFLKICPKYISEGLQKRDLGEIYAAISNSRDYLFGVMPYLPQKGKIGIENKKISSALKGCYENSKNARSIILKLKESEEMHYAGEIKTTIWQAKRIGFDLDFNSIKSQMEREYKKSGSIKKTLEIIEKSRVAMHKGYLDQFNSVLDSYKKKQAHANNYTSYKDPFNEFERQLNAYEKMDAVKHSDLLTEVNSFLKELQNAYALESSKLDALYKKTEDTSYNIMIALDNRMTSYFYEMKNFPSNNYVGLQKLKIPKISYPNRAFAYLDSLRRPIIQERIHLNHYIDLVSLLYAINVKDAKNGMRQYIQISKTIDSFIASSRFHILFMKDEYIKNKNSEIENFIKKMKPKIKHLLSLQKSAQNNEQKYETNLSNMENDIDYLERLENVVETSDKAIYSHMRTFQDNLSIHGYYKPYIKAHTCDILSATKNPLMTKDDIHTSMQKLKTKLSQIGLVWLDSKYNIGLKEYLKKLENHYQKHAAPDHYMFYKSVYCELLTKNQIDHLHEWLKKMLPIKNCDRQFSKSFENMNETLRFLLKAYDQGLGSFDYAMMPKDHLKFLVQLSKKVPDKVIQNSLQALLNTARTIDKEFWNCRTKNKYYNKMQEEYSKMLGVFHGFVYDVSYENMHAADTNKLINLTNKALSMKSTLYDFLSKRINDAHLGQNDKDTFALYKKNLINEFYSLEEFLRNLKLRTSHKKQQQKQKQDSSLIVNFYAKFKEAYESKDVSVVMAYISDDWSSSSDGTSISDLETNLENSFRVFDEIQYNISNLNIQPMGEDKFRASYNVSIIGEIYDDDITHEEKSSVQEEVGIKNGKIMILKTFGGQYWSIK